MSENPQSSFRYTVNKHGYDMNAKLMVRICRIVDVASIVFLVYWIFALTIVNVFKLNVFQSTINNTFIMGFVLVLVLMLCSLIISSTLNLTLVTKADSFGRKGIPSFVKLLLYIICSGFPVLGGFIYWGNYKIIENKKGILSSKIASLVSDKRAMDSVALYSFSVAWCKHVHSTLTSYQSKIGDNYHIGIIPPETWGEKNSYFLQFDKNSMNDSDSTIHNGEHYLYKPDIQDREYLYEVFSGERNDEHFRTDGNNDILYVPYIVNNKRVIISISNYKRYGKL